MHIDNALTSEPPAQTHPAPNPHRNPARDSALTRTRSSRAAGPVIYFFFVKTFSSKNSGGGSEESGGELTLHTKNLPFSGQKNHNYFGAIMFRSGLG